MTRVTTEREGERIGLVRAGDGDAPLELEILADTAEDPEAGRFRQWFAFTLESDGPEEREVVLANAGEVTFGGAWDGYEVHVLPAGSRVWRRAPTTWDGEALRFLHRAAGASTRYAYFAPYAVDRAARLALAAGDAPHARVDVLGVSCEGRPLHRVTFGDPDAARVAWVVARQHPGETPASWAAEGLLRAAAASPERFDGLCLHVVPLVNPDGAARGNMRTNAAGRDLNRTWDDPDEDDAPEVAHVRRAVLEAGCDLFVDVHADESARWAFPSLCEGNPSWDEEIGALEERFAELLADRSPDFVAEPFYDLDPPGGADLSIAANQIGEALGCPAATLELPFKASGGGRVRDGFSPARARQLGAALLDVLRHTLQDD